MDLRFGLLFFAFASILQPSFFTSAFANDQDPLIEISDPQDLPPFIPNTSKLQELDAFSAEFVVKPRSLKPGILMMKTREWNRDGFYLEIDQNRRLAFSVARDQKDIDGIWIRSSEDVDRPDAIDLSGEPRVQIGMKHDQVMDGMVDFAIEAEVKFSHIVDQGFLLKTANWTTEGFFLAVKDRRLEFGLGRDDDKEPARLLTPQPIQEDRWYKVRATKRGDLAWLSIDGETVAERHVSPELGASKAGLYVHAGQELGLQVRQLNLTRLDPSIRGSTDRPLFALDIDEGGGTKLFDSTGEDRNAALLAKSVAVRSGADALSTGRWQRVFLRHGEGRSQIYIDGEEVADAATPNGIVDNTAPLAFKAKGAPADVEIQAFRLWNKPFNPSDVPPQGSNSPPSGAERVADLDTPGHDDTAAGNDQSIERPAPGTMDSAEPGFDSMLSNRLSALIEKLAKPKFDQVAHESYWPQELFGNQNVGLAQKADTEAAALADQTNATLALAPSHKPALRPKDLSKAQSSEQVSAMSAVPSHKPARRPELLQVAQTTETALEPPVADMPAPEAAAEQAKSEALSAELRKKLEEFSKAVERHGTDDLTATSAENETAETPTGAEAAAQRPVAEGPVPDDEPKPEAGLSQDSEPQPLTEIYEDETAPGEPDSETVAPISPSTTEVVDQSVTPVEPAREIVPSPIESTNGQTISAEPVTADVDQQPKATTTPIEPEREILTKESATKERVPVSPVADSPIGLVSTPENALYDLKLVPGKGELVRVERPAADVVVADPNVANVRILAPQLIYLFGNGLGNTDVFVLDSSQDVLARVQIEVHPDADNATAELARQQPKTNVDIEPALGGLAATGVVTTAAEARDVSAIADNMSTPDLPVENNTSIAGSQQVNIRVRFAEVSRNDVFRLGLNWRAIFESGDFLFGLSSGDLFSALPSVSPDLPVGNTGFGRFDDGNFSLDLLLDGLQQEGVIRVLAEPNLTAVNGEPAEFLAGGEVPIPVPDGDNGITFEFKQFGVSLDFTPTILPGGRINLRVRPEVSELVTVGGVLVDGFSIPAFSIRRTDTSVELASGQTFAVAGLFQRNLSDTVDQFPGLGSLPILGALFTSKRYLRAETELVILITPYLVEPEGRRNLLVPGRQASAGTVRASHLPSPRRPAGPAGFILN